MDNHSFYSQLCEQEKQINETLIALRKLKDYYRSNNGDALTNGNNKGKIEIPETYSDKLTLKKRILFALSKLGEGTTKDIAKFLSDTDKNYPLDKALSDATIYASSLYRKKVIGATKEGVKNIYYIK